VSYAEVLGGQKYHVRYVDLILRALDCIVIISFALILYCDRFNLFCNLWVCECVGDLLKRVLVFTVFCIFCTVF
jgi:hypothetical protein